MSRVLTEVEKEAASYFRHALMLLGVDMEHDPNTSDTPKRWVLAIEDILSGMYDTADQVGTIMQARFPTEYREVVTVNGIHTFGMCPHHFLPIEYWITVGYLPSANGQCLGISKLARLAVILARRPVLQEDLTRDIIKTLNNSLSPDGAGVIVTGRHGCMACRGIQQTGASTVTSSLSGAMLTPELRAEFMQLHNMGIK